MTEMDKHDIGFDPEKELGYGTSKIARKDAKITGHADGKFLRLTQYDYHGLWDMD